MNIVLLMPVFQSFILYCVFKLLFKDTKMRQNTVFAPEFLRFVSFYHRLSSKSVLWLLYSVSPSLLRSRKSAQGGRKQPFFLHLCCHHLLFQLFYDPLLPHSAHSTSASLAPRSYQHFVPARWNRV